MSSNEEVVRKLREIESALQDQDNESKDLKSVINELKSIVQDLDKDMAIQAEKQSHMFYRVEQLQRELETLENRGERGSDRHRDLVEKTLMVVLGGLIAYIFSLAKQ